MPIAAFVTMIAKPGAEEELLARLTDVIADVRTEPGNLLAVLARDPADPSRIYEFAIYRDQAAIEAHRAARHSLEKGPLVRELFAEPMDPRMLETIDWPQTQKVG
jgi:quinol monooxygenase YgiN